MFTGIIEDMGQVVAWSESGPGQGWELKIKPEHPELFFKAQDAQMYIGASICVSGVCLTVTAYDSTTMSFGVAPETVRRTNFGNFKAGVSKVNLERASASGARNSGHYVQGHVDGVGKVVKRWQEKESLWYKIEVSKELVAGIVEKGYVAVEGTSLTVCEVHTTEPAWFTLMLIHHTQQHVVLPSRLEGDTVNLECDVMAKYAASAVQELRRSMDAMQAQHEATVKALETRLSALENDVQTTKRMKSTTSS
jgi:riboflavin synthase